MRISLVVFLILAVPLSSFAQMGPPVGRPSILILETTQAETGTNEGVKRQWTAGVGAPPLKFQDFKLITNLNYSDIQLVDRALPVLPYTDFQSLTLSLIGSVEQDSGNGWVFFTSVGSASDKIFINGDGIGPEIMAATLNILEAAGANFAIDTIEIGEKVYAKGLLAGIEPSAWENLLQNKVFLKAPITTPQGGGFKSLNVTVRKTLGLNH